VNRQLLVCLSLSLLLLAGCSKTVRVTSEPPGAEIRLDGKPTGLRTPAEIVVFRKHDIQTLALCLQGYQEEVVYVEHRNAFWDACTFPCGCAGFFCAGGPTEGRRSPMNKRMIEFVSAPFSLGTFIDDKIHLDLRPMAAKQESRP